MSLEILFGFVEQAVQADRREMVGIGSEGAEAKGDVEARFAQAAVAAIKLRRQSDVLRRRAIRVRGRSPEKTCGDAGSHT